MHRDDVFTLEDPAAAGLGSTVHLDVATLHQDLRVTTRAGSAGELEEGPQRQRPVDQDIVQLLNRIGMMRYVKSSPAPLMIPGRSGLVKRIITAASSTASMPSMR